MDTYKYNIMLDFDKNMRCIISAIFEGIKTPLGKAACSYSIKVNGRIINDFVLVCNSEEKINGRTEYEFLSTRDGIKQRINIAIKDEFPGTAFTNATYTNTGIKDVLIEEWVNNSTCIMSNRKKDNSPLFWSYQCASYEERPDWVLPMKIGFYQENYLGMNSSDYGGGTPVCDVWNKDMGVAVGHLSIKPELVSIPVTVDENGEAILEISKKENKVLKPGESFKTLDTFVMVHRGDYFNALSEYRKIMMQRGVAFKAVTPEAYEPTWCAWGYERDFTMEMIYGALPMVKKLGIKWVCLDDGWQTEEGDYTLIKKKFPNGEADMRKFVDTLHQQGFKAQLWWIPLAIDPRSDLYREHPEYLLTDYEGKPQYITWFDSYYMCPAHEDVMEHTKQALKKILIDWDYDGLKIDGQHLNAAPSCHNPGHNHEYPERSYEAISEFFKMIYDIAREYKPDVTIMFCPCGTSYSFFTMPYYNIPVASDPLSSWQVRLKGKAFKALMGPYTAFHGDHVELSDDEKDFASTIGIGGVIDTKFTWPEGSAPVSVLRPESTYDLTQGKVKEWAKWLEIYREKELSKGEYLGGLYTMGYSFPEGHAVKVENRMYFAFYADSFEGYVRLKGLEKRMYRVEDYVDGKVDQIVNGEEASIAVCFEKYLLLEAVPI